MFCKTNLFDSHGRKKNVKGHGMEFKYYFSTVGLVNKHLNSYVKLHSCNNEWDIVMAHRNAYRILPHQIQNSGGVFGFFLFFLVERRVFHLKWCLIIIQGWRRRCISQVIFRQYDILQKHLNVKIMELLKGVWALNPYIRFWFTQYLLLTYVPSTHLDLMLSLWYWKITNFRKYS